MQNPLELEEKIYTLIFEKLKILRMSLRKGKLIAKKFESERRVLGLTKN